MQYVAELAGQDAACPSCNQIFNVPVLDQSALASVPTNPAQQQAPAASPFTGGQNSLKPLPAQYAHLRKDAPGIHNKKIIWLCVLGIGPTIFWLAFVILSAIINS